MTLELNSALPEAMLAACPAYRVTPLASRNTADGRSVLIKDETDRMGLGAFKALGGVYAVAQLISNQLARPVAPEEFLSAEVRAVAESMTFVCASAGNHGMAVAAGAKIFGAQARIHLSATVPDEFSDRLAARGAEVVRSGADYEESVAAAIADAKSSGAIHLADGSWPGYTEPPRLVMEGYTVIAEEMRRTLEADGNWPSHVYLQAGVGGLAASMAYMIRKNWAQQPEIIVVEPEAAPCLRDSARVGKLVTVSGPVSNMGRLDCKTASMLAFDILRTRADRYVTVSDGEALQAVAAARDLGFSTTPSGVAGFAALLADMTPGARGLVIFSEGSVDGDN